MIHGEMGFYDMPRQAIVILATGEGKRQGDVSRMVGMVRRTTSPMGASVEASSRVSRGSLSQGLHTTIRGLK
jgi:hypothetical protein